MSRSRVVLVCLLLIPFFSCGMKKELEKLNQNLQGLQSRLDRLDANAKEALNQFAGKLDNLMQILRAMPADMRGQAEGLLKKAKDDLVLGLLVLKSQMGVTMEDIAAKVGPMLIKSLGNLSDEELTSLGKKFSKLFEGTPLVQEMHSMASSLGSVLPDAKALLSKADSFLSDGKSRRSDPSPAKVRFAKPSIPEDQLVDLSEARRYRHGRTITYPSVAPSH